MESLVHIRESEIYLGTGELLYNVIAVYIITLLIKPSAKCVSHYHILAVSCLFIFTLFQTVQRHGVNIIAYERQSLLLLLYNLVPIM